VSLFPDRVTRERPRSTDTDEEIALGLSYQYTHIIKEYRQCRHHHRSHIEARTQAPRNRKQIDIEEENLEDQDEAVKIFLEFSDVGFKRINLGNDEKKTEQHQGHDRQQEKPPNFGHIAIHFTIIV